MKKFFNKLIKIKVFQFGNIDNKYIETFLKSRKIKKKFLMQESEEKKDLDEIFSKNLDFDLNMKSDKKGKKNYSEKNNSFKLNKKLAQGIKVLVHKEQKIFEELCDSGLHKNLFVVHFGNGRVFFLFKKF